MITQILKSETKSKIKCILNNFYNNVIYVMHEHCIFDEYSTINDNDFYDIIFDEEMSFLDDVDRDVIIEFMDNKFVIKKLLNMHKKIIKYAKSQIKYNN